GSVRSARCSGERGRREVCRRNGRSAATNCVPVPDRHRAGPLYRVRRHSRGPREDGPAPPARLWRPARKRRRGGAEALHQIKAQERRAKAAGSPAEQLPESALNGVPRTLPSTLQALQLTKQAARTGFDWPDVAGILDKIQEEIAELR